MESAAERGPVKTLRNGRGRGVGPVACARGCSELARLDTVYLIGPSILTCRHADMPTCRITGLFGTASERQILMAGVRGRLEKGRQAAKATSCLCSVRPVARDKESPPRARHGERLSKGQGSASFIPSWRDATRSREPPSLSSRGKQAGKQASRQAGIRQLHHDVTAARHKGNNRAKRGASNRPLAPAGKKGTKGRATGTARVSGRWAP